MKMHRTASRSRQRGLSFLGLVFLAVLALMALAIVVRSVPIFLEYASAKKAIQKAKDGISVADARETFDRAAAIGDVHSIKGSDLEVSKQGDKIAVSFKYSREIHLFGPAYLTYRFEAQTE
ncbi:DUF4845 domain-containing protein [Verminephrobacter aporrectodeae subsp. tuberculatae]|uniref:DUF4845 domain-containing protein n=1 Tax=Verminephrobacter aporrectodeae subsp. tuberculatae TaxID=1110392 RepID=A0ABT3KW73_9BURK|nr:DUF4845 domain-containing protein [Verminephrobacter aporrectodeae]MCW5322496.1 DUF4845 domain-containing protein [Verminephrobacter aporrectodeae subsp. tuberculatae]MCW8208136.1 DUF4845 domain-containing protein [Verminephrobacter aporrectodeae subsp. tuberculatae]